MGCNQEGITLGKEIFEIRTHHVHELIQSQVRTYTKVPSVCLCLGPVKSLEIEFSITGLLSPLIQPIGPSWLCVA